MKHLISVLFILLTIGINANVSHADPQIGQNPMGESVLDSIEWNNVKPEQRQALDNYYQSLQQSNTANIQPDRMQNLEQLRNMSSEQRQQMFRNFVEQNQARPFR